MNYLLIGGLATLLLAIVAGCRFGWELLQQNGRMLLRMEALEKRLEDRAEDGQQKSETHQPLDASVLFHDNRVDRFSSRSLANSKIKRDGLKAGTVAPEFCLPRLDGGELALSDLRGKMVLLVFSSPHCGPCNTLAPKLQNFHRKHSTVELVMISQGEPDENRAKVKEHGLTFPVVLQKQWEVSRDYAYFATPVAYLIDEAGVITSDVAVGVEPVVDLMMRVERILRRPGKHSMPAWLQRTFGWPRMKHQFHRSA